MAILLPLMALSRLKARAIPHDADVEREITLSPRINGILMTMLRAEVRLTLAGLRWPLGGSRVVVRARRLMQPDQRVFQHP
jgi:hypothetical protein